MRRPVVLLAALATAGLFLLAILYGGMEGAGLLDARAGARIQDGLGEHRAFLRHLIRFADPPSVAAVSVLLALTCVVLRRRRLAVVAFAGPALTGLATTVLQPAIGRTLDGGFALPSGHTASATALATVAALLAVSLADQRPLPVALLAATGVLMVGTTMAVALVANGLHFVTDTAAGFCTAVAIVLGTAPAVDHVADRLGMPSDDEG